MSSHLLLVKLGLLGLSIVKCIELKDKLISITSWQDSLLVLTKMVKIEGKEEDCFIDLPNILMK